MHYLRTWFFVDLISIIPIDWILTETLPEGDPQTANLELLSIVRMCRLLRLIKLIRILRASRIFRR